MRVGIPPPPLLILICTAFGTGNCTLGDFDAAEWELILTKSPALPMLGFLRKGNPASGEHGWPSVTDPRSARNPDTRNRRSRGTINAGGLIGAIRSARRRAPPKFPWPGLCRRPSRCCRPSWTGASPFGWRSSSAGCSWPAIDARPARGSSSPECKTIGTGSTIA